MLDLSSARTATLPFAIPTFRVSLTPAAPAGTALGLALPTKPMTSAQQGDRAALWLGPDEWLLLAPAAETAALYQHLTAALEGIACALVDISHRQTALIAAGPQATVLLNAGVPLDLSPGAFPVGMVTRTLFEKAEIVLWRTGHETFRIEVWRSFAPYLLAMLHEADRDMP